jgi:putative acetyltransferase
MIHCIRTNSDNKYFRELVSELDADLKIRDGADHSFYSRYNKIDKIKYAVVAFENETAVGCGAIKELSKDSMEVKRMFVPPKRRGQGVATIILNELEIWSLELKYSKCVLETGKKQPEAIELYKKTGYRIIPNYGQYEKVENSVCFEKILIEQFLKGYDAPVPELAGKLRKFIKKEIPGIEEQLDISARILGYGFGTGYSGMICTIILSRKGVKLGFYKGVELPDPSHLLQGSGKVHKYVELKSNSEIQSPALRNLLLQAHAAYLRRKTKS